MTPSQLLACSLKLSTPSDLCSGPLIVIFIWQPFESRLSFLFETRHLEKTLTACHLPQPPVHFFAAANALKGLVRATLSQVPPTALASSFVAFFWKRLV
jgi:hypothetical protein